MWAWVKINYSTHVHDKDATCLGSDVFLNSLWNMKIFLIRWVEVQVDTKLKRPGVLLSLHRPTTKYSHGGRSWFKNHSKHTDICDHVRDVFKIREPSTGLCSLWPLSYISIQTGWWGPVCLRQGDSVSGQCVTVKVLNWYLQQRSSYEFFFFNFKFQSWHVLSGFDVNETLLAKALQLILLIWTTR